MMRVTFIISKLYLVEGVPGAGKTATAEFIAEHISASGAHAHWFEDLDIRHPADYTFHAYMRESQVNLLKPEERRQIFVEGIRAHEGYIIPLTQISVSLFEKILPYKIYGNLDWETERRILLEHWRNFVDDCQRTDTVHIFEGSFLQNPVSETMLRLNLGDHAVESYVKQIYDLTSCLKPVVIYLRSSDVAKCSCEFLRADQPAWLASLVEFHTSQGYAKCHQLSGLEGYITCLEHRQRLELELLEKLGIESLIINDPYDDWDAAEATLKVYLDHSYKTTAGKI